MATRKQTPEEMISTGDSFARRVDRGDMPSDAEVQELKYTVGHNLGLTVEEIDDMTIEELTEKVNERIKKIDQLTRPQLPQPNRGKKFMN